MQRYIISRLLMTIPSLLGVSILVFSMLHLIPGDPVLMMVQYVTAGVDLEAIRHNLGLDLPLHVQYWRFISKAVRGDLGRALIVDRPVIKMIMDKLPYTLRISALAMVSILVFGLSLGVLAALNVNSWLDSLFMTIAVSGVSMPEFWLGLLLILIFCVRLGWFPIFGEESLKVMILPAFVLGFRPCAVMARMTRSGLLEVMGEDYIRTARAKGLSGRVVVVRHALKNALIPVVTIMGLYFGGLLSGAVLVEAVFARQGIGHLAVHAILQRDCPLAQGTVLFTSTVFVLMNVVVDIGYTFLDPRIRCQRRWR